MYYDYFEKDHQGNIGVVLTDEIRKDLYPVASLETTPLPGERIYYDRLDSGRENKSTIAGYPSDTYTTPNDYVQKLKGNAVKIGASTMLRKISKSWHISGIFNLRWFLSDSPPILFNR